MCRRVGARKPVCYVYVMAIKRITISVRADVASRIKKAAGATPVSTWLTDLVEEHLNDAELEQQWQSFYADVKPTAADMTSAESKLKRLTKRKSRRRSAA